MRDRPSLFKSSPTNRCPTTFGYALHNFIGTELDKFYFHMPRRILVRSNVSPYHVTARCNNREPFHNDLDEVWKIFTFEFNSVVETHQALIHAFVLMPNHFHLIISTPKDDLGLVMRTFMASVTKHLNTKSGRIGRVFGSRYHWSLISSTHYYDCALKYVYRNPVKAGLTENVENYPYSTLIIALGNRAADIPISPVLGYDFNIPGNNNSKFLGWLNQPFQGEQHQAIHKALQKKKFSPPQERGRRIPMKLDRFCS